MAHRKRIYKSNPRNGGTRIRIRNSDRTRNIVTISICTSNWRTKSHPYFWVSNMGTLFTVHVMAVEVVYYKGKR